MRKPGWKVVSLLSIVAACALAPTTGAQAEMYRLSFSGITTLSEWHTQEDDPTILQDLPIFAPGTPFSGMIEFDPSTPGSFGSYDNAIASHSITIGGETFSLVARRRNHPFLLDNSIGVTNDSPVNDNPANRIDGFGFGFTETFNTGEHAVDGSLWLSRTVMMSSDLSTFSSDALPLSWPSTLFDRNHEMYLSAENEGNFYESWFWRGDEQSVEIAPVPLPAAAWLLFIGLGMLRLTARQSPRKSPA